jgi:hypothetical protein
VEAGEGEGFEPFLWRFLCLVAGAVDASGAGEAAPVIADADLECLRFFLAIGDGLAIGIFMPLAIGIAIALDMGFGIALLFVFAVLVPAAPF